MPFFSALNRFILKIKRDKKKYFFPFPHLFICTISDAVHSFLKIQISIQNLSPSA